MPLCLLYWPINASSMGRWMIPFCLNLSIYDGLQSRTARASSHFWEVKPNALPVRPRQKGKKVRYIIDRMTMADVPRVVEIERLAYPSTWPPSAYRKELQDNRWAHYIVLRDKKILEERLSVAAPEPEKPRRFFPLWLMVDVAHITTIAMHPDYQGRGLGEFMLASLIDIAYDIKARWVTLEVRVSNYVAQNLYRKYGFHEAGIRHRYYSDNNEDALIMWTDEIHSPAYKQKFLELKEVLLKKLEAQQA